jgi:hypothetical protein
MPLGAQRRGAEEYASQKNSKHCSLSLIGFELRVQLADEALRGGGRVGDN